MQTRKNDSAHPCIHEDGCGSFTAELGLTKHEYFAALALQGILSNSSLDQEDYNPANYANLAIEAAEILIIQLNKSNSERYENGN